MPTDKHEDKKLTPQEWRDKDLGDRAERMRALAEAAGRGVERLRAQAEAAGREPDPNRDDCEPPVLSARLAELFRILRRKVDFLQGFGEALGENGKPLRREASEIVMLIGRYERGQALGGASTAGVTMTEE